MARTQKIDVSFFLFLLFSGIIVGSSFAADLFQIEDALADFYAEHNQRGLETVKAILEDEPDNATALALQALFEIRLGRTMSASGLIKKALEIEPDNAIAHIADAAYRSYYVDDDQGVNATIEKAIELDPELAMGYNERGFNSFWLGDLESAVADFERAVELEPNFLAAQTNLGLAYLYLDNADSALIAYQRAAEINPQSPSGYAGRGYYYAYVGEYDTAIEDYTHAIEIDDQDPNSFVLRGDAYLISGAYKLGLADYTKAIELGAEEANVYASRAWAHSELGNQEEALVDYESAIVIDPEFSYAYNGAAYLIAFNDGDLQKALAYVETALELLPGDPDSLDTRAFILYKMGDYEEALEQFSALIADGYTAGHYGRGLVNQALGEVEEAINDFQTFLEAYPDYEPLSSDAQQRLETLESSSPN